MNRDPRPFVLAVGSGKGGVGKSTATLQLGLGLVDRGLRVAILDADLYGPDIPLMVGVSRQEQARQLQLWRRDGGRLPPVERHGLALVSVGFMISESQALALAAPLLTAALTRLAREVDWGVRDVLLLDLPPGTADLQQQLLDVVRVDGALVVVGPQDAAHLDARRFVDFLRGAGVSILGGVQNMDGFACPHCGEVAAIFPPVADARSIWAAGVDLLGGVPVDPRLGAEPARLHPAFAEVADRVLASIRQG